MYYTEVTSGSCERECQTFRDFCCSLNVRFAPKDERCLIASPWALYAASYRLRPTLRKGLERALCNRSGKASSMSVVGQSHHFERARSVSVCPLLLRSLPIYLTAVFVAKGQQRAHALQHDRRGRISYRPVLVLISALTERTPRSDRSKIRSSVFIRQLCKWQQRINRGQ